MQKSEKYFPLSPHLQPSMSTLVLRFKDLFSLLFQPSESKAANGNALGEYESESVQKTLDNNYVPKEILDARKKQDALILERYQGKKLAIADIGCGDGYHGEFFAPSATLYHGFEISTEMADKTRKRWEQNGLTNTQVFQGDAAKMALTSNAYDVAWSLYFTAGNFREEFDDLSSYTDEYLNKNPQFIRIIKNFYEALKKGGKLHLTVYKDVPQTETAQRKFYQDTGQTVITPLGSRFVATKENFWSVRWTKESMLSNLVECGIKPEQVTFTDLNEVAWFVEIEK